MKKILAAFLALAVLSLFVACTKQEMKDDMTTLKNELSTMVDDMSEALGGTTEENTTDTTAEDTTAATDESTTENTTDGAGLTADTTAKNTVG